MANFNLTSDLINRYSDVSVSDEVCYGLSSDVDDDDNIVGKIFEANFEGGSSFWDVFSGIIDSRNNIDVVHCMNFLNSDDALNDNDEEVVTSLRTLMTDLSTLVGLEEAFNIVSNFDGDAW
jgi:hypothetical protein